MNIYIYIYVSSIDFYWHLFISTFNLSSGHGPLPARPFPKVFGEVVMGRSLGIHQLIWAQSQSLWIIFSFPIKICLNGT